MGVRITDAESLELAPEPRTPRPEPLALVPEPWGKGQNQAPWRSTFLDRRSVRFLSMK